MKALSFPPAGQFSLRWMRGIFLCLGALLFDLCECLWFHPKLPEHPQRPVQHPSACGCTLLPWLPQAVSAEGLIVPCVLSSACTATRWTIQALRWWEPLRTHIAFGQEEENAPGSSCCHCRDVSSHFGFSFFTCAGAICVSFPHSSKQCLAHCPRPSCPL